MPTDCISLLRGISGGQWVKANLNQFSDAWPAIPDRTTAGSPVSVMGAWSSYAWDARRGNVMLFGGGHGNYAGNEMYLWSMSTRLWSIGALPSNVVAVTLSPGNVCYMPADGPDKGPPSMHTYDGANYLELADRYFTLNGPSYNYAGGPLLADGGPVTGPYTWDPSKADPNKVGGSDGSGYNPSRLGSLSWQNRDSQTKFTVTWWFGTRGLNAVDGASASLVEGGKDCVIFGATDGSTGYLCRYTFEANPINDTVKIIGVVDAGAPSGAGYYGAGSYCASRKWFVALTTHATKPIVAWDCGLTPPAGPYYPSDFTNNSVNPAFPGGLAGFAPAGTDGIDYDPVLDRWFIWNGYGDVWMLAPPTSGGLAGNWTLTQVTVGAGIGAGLKPEYLNTFGGGVRGKWHYAANLHCMVAVEGSTGDGNVWLWRPPGWTEPALMLAQESGSDTATFTGPSSAGTMAAVESGSDTARFGYPDPSGAMVAAEGGSDAAAFLGAAPAAGTLAAVEAGSDTAAFTASDADAVWTYMLPNGMAAADCAASMQHLIDELHIVHGLDEDEALVVSNTLRAAGAILQAITPTSITRQ